MNIRVILRPSINSLLSSSNHSGHSSIYSTLVSNYLCYYISTNPMLLQDLSLSHTKSSASSYSTTEMPKQTVAYLGPRSSYAHQAALDCFDPKKYDFEPQTTIADIFHVVQSNICTYGVVPFENSTNGSVVITLDLLCDRDNQFPDARVCRETYLDVHHCLLGQHRPDFSSVKKIYSHPQAFGQCEKFLSKHLKGVERIDVSSTSMAAEKTASDPSAVAIASRIATQVYNIKILAENIEDSPDNTTRFLILSSTVSSPISRKPGEIDKTVLSFTVDHTKPGALCDTLEVFRNYGLNLTSISSRPSRVVPWNYIFIVEFEGHKDSKNTQDALNNVRSYCSNMRVLGSYQDKQRKRLQK